MRQSKRVAGVNVLVPCLVPRRRDKAMPGTSSGDRFCNILGGMRQPAASVS